MNEASGTHSSRATSSCSMMMLMIFSSSVMKISSLQNKPCSGRGVNALSRASDVKTAIDAQDLSRDVTGFLRGQEGNGRGNLLRPARPAERDLFEGLLQALFRQGSDHFRIDKSRRDGVDADGPGRQLPCE